MLRHCHQELLVALRDQTCISALQKQHTLSKTANIYSTITQISKHEAFQELGLTSDNISIKDLWKLL